MGELQQVLNKFRIMDETLSSIPSFADFTWNNNQKKFITKLAEFNSMQEMGLGSISNSKREKILEKWNLYINSNDQSQIKFNLKEIEFLSTQTNIFLNDSFWDLLMDLSAISHKIIIGLVYNIHILWTEIKDFNKIIDSITFMILEHKQENKLIQFWRENIELVLSEKSPINLATKLVDENLNLSTLSDKYYLSLNNTNLGKEIEKCVLEAKLNKFKREKNIKPTDLNYIFVTLSGGLFSKQEGNKILSLALQIVDECLNQTKMPCIDTFRDYLLNNIDYKDPREYPEKWLTFEDSGKNIFMKWLNERDIRVFFDLFIDYDPHRRKDFWLKYAGKVKKTTILKGNNVQQNFKNKDEINLLIANGNKFVPLDAPTNAFILEFDNIIAVEFSEAGNACYIYNKESFLQQINYRNNYSIEDLKNKVISMNIVPHHQGWQGKLLGWLAMRGIRA